MRVWLTVRFRKLGAYRVSQCMTARMKVALSAASGAFMPIGPPPLLICAENAAASPKAAIRPSPTSRIAPCDRPSATSSGVSASNFQASRGSRTA